MSGSIMKIALGIHLKKKIKLFSFSLAQNYWDNGTIG